MGLSLFACCSCLRQCDAGVAVQLEETVLTSQSKITVAMYFLKQRFALVIYAKQIIRFVQT